MVVRENLWFPRMLPKSINEHNFLNIWPRETLQDSFLAYGSHMRAMRLFLVVIWACRSCFRRTFVARPSAAGEKIYVRARSWTSLDSRRRFFDAKFCMWRWEWRHWAPGTRKKRSIEEIPPAMTPGDPKWSLMIFFDIFNFEVWAVMQPIHEYYMTSSPFEMINYTHIQYELILCRT